MDSLPIPVLIFGSILAVSTLSFAGIALFCLNTALIRRLILFFVSFSAGALLGDVFLHMLPEIMEDTLLIQKSFILVLLGIIASFIIEKIIHWRHCHSLDHVNHIHPMGVLNLIGDAVHNFIDGLLIAGSFLVSVPVGIATTLAVTFHEIPQEIGDFAILIHSGFSRKKALLMNLLSALTAFLGAGLVFFASSSIQNIGSILLPLTAGNFLYIAVADLIPELHKETRLPQALLQLVCMSAGIGVMWWMLSLE